MSGYFTTATYTHKLLQSTPLLVHQDFLGTVMNANLGDKDAQVALGDMYRNGKGVQQDYQTAMVWYLRAADQGDSQGQSKVALLYRDGLGVRQHHATAIKWYLKAAEQGDSLHNGMLPIRTRKLKV
ncbi:hypothetical protein BGX24_001680 [Mortierella sp. AD032]|nr:hypothetical protein BGX24_001680 [Mortierella sp. AD032]